MSGGDARGGKDLLLEVETAPSVYTLLGGLRTKSFTINSEAIETTNHGSGEYKEMLDGSGIRSMSLSGGGVSVDDATLVLVEDNCIANTLTNFRITDQSTNGRTYTVCCKIASVERAGEYNAEQTYSISLESSGVITIA